MNQRKYMLFEIIAAIFSALSGIIVASLVYSHVGPNLITAAIIIIPVTMIIYILILLFLLICT